jgi:SNF2 family DNA or RNA helicase
MWGGIAEAVGAFLGCGSSKLYQTKLKTLLASLKGQKTGFRTVDVINFDKVPAVIELLLKRNYDAIIVDESHKIKSPSSARGRAVRRLCFQSQSVRLLTGTLVPNNPADLWGQMVCVSRDVWGSSFTRFKRTHLIVDELMYGRVLGVKDSKLLQKMVDECSVTYRREDVFGADNWQVVVRDFELEPKARRLYDQIVKDWIIEEQGLDLDLTHTLARMLRLQQLTSGYLPGDDDKPLSIHNQKLDLVMADLDGILEAGEKAVIFHRFTWEGEQLAKLTEKLGHPVFKIDGSVPASRRADDIVRFNALRGGTVYIVQTAAGGVGIDLSSARHALFVSQSFSFDAEEQARDRIFKPGTARTVSYYRANRSIDNYIAYILETKQRTHEAIRNSRIVDIAYSEVVKTESMKY